MYKKLLHLSLLTATLPLATRTLANETATYAFTSNFDGASNVSYTGQSFRQVLISDLASYTANLEKGSYAGSSDEAYLALDSYYSYKSDNPNEFPGVIYGYAQFGIAAWDADGKQQAVKGLYYRDLQEPGKQLRNKTAGNDNPLRRGALKGWSLNAFYGQDLEKMESDRASDGFIEPEDLADAWMRVIAHAAANEEAFDVSNGEQDRQWVTQAAVTPNGWDLNQLLQKFLHGAVSYSQAARDYLSTDLGDTKGLNADNEQPYEGTKNYTALEHHWDEGFGYFGAARDFLKYDLAQISAGSSLDTNADGEIDLLAEKNQGIAINAAKRDLGAKVATSFAKDAMTAFIEGRRLITDRPEGYREKLPLEAKKALSNWEKVIGASVVHYINETIEDMAAYGTDSYSFTQHAKHWSEMKGYALAFQFNPNAAVSDEAFDEMHRLMADEPVLGSQGEQALFAYKARLLQARAILQTSLGFASENVEGW